MLTPASDDPNRKAELKRKAERPHDFGMPRLDTKEVAGRKLEGYKLVTGQGLKEPQPENVETEEQRIAREAVEQEAAEARAGWVAYLDQPVPALIAELPEIEGVEQLTAMSTIEAETKNRKTLIEAIAAEIAKRAV